MGRSHISFQLSGLTGRACAGESGAGGATVDADGQDSSTCSPRPPEVADLWRIEHLFATVDGARRAGGHAPSLIDLAKGWQT